MDALAMSGHHLESVDSGGGERVTISIRWNKGRMVVHIDPTPSGNLPEDSFIKNHDNAFGSDNDEEAEAIIEEMLDAIVEVGRSTFDQHAPPPDNSTSQSDLHSLLFPEEFEFYFLTLDNKPSLIPNTSPEPHIKPEFDLEVDVNANLPKFSTKDIVVTRQFMSDGYISRVIAGGQEMCAKVANRQHKVSSIQKELTALSKISTSRYDNTIRVPALIGLVQDADDGRIIGFLEQYIPSPESVEAIWTLRDIESVPSIEEPRRKKWAMQVQETISMLHEISVIWGNGKASNILINYDTDDAWVIDFGRCGTSWVEKELRDTIEGDMIAVKKIFEFLQIQ